MFKPTSLNESLSSEPARDQLRLRAVVKEQFPDSSTSHSAFNGKQSTEEFHSNKQDCGRPRASRASIAPAPTADSHTPTPLTGRIRELLYRELKKSLFETFPNAEKR